MSKEGIISAIISCENQITELDKEYDNKSAIAKEEIESKFNTKINEIVSKIRAIEKDLETTNDKNDEGKAKRKEKNTLLKKLNKEVKTISKNRNTEIKTKLKEIEEERKAGITRINREITVLKKRLSALERVDGYTVRI